MGKKILPVYLKFNKEDGKVVEKSSPSLPPISPLLNMMDSPPISTATPTVIPPPPTLGAPPKVLKPYNMKKSYVQASKMTISSNIKDIL